MWELDCEESWAPKNWCFWTVVLEKTLESPCKGIQPVHPKWDQSWVFTGRTDAEAEILILWPPHGKSWLTGKDPVAGRDWGQEEKGTTEDEVAGCHHWLNGHEFEWTPGVGDGQGGLACCDSWGRKELDTTERLNWTELNMTLSAFTPYPREVLFSTSQGKKIMSLGPWPHHLWPADPCLPSPAKSSLLSPTEKGHSDASQTFSSASPHHPWAGPP